jgi:NADH-quinone oxidoreductase subunit G
MSDKEIEIEIDGQPLKALSSQTIMQVADAANIYIPRFCYHKHLSIAANCRMCLVEVEKAPKTLPACATPIMPGMKVFTKSSKTRLSQRAVMEFLLINHPLDCPICDQGGECELQDLAMGYGSSHSDYQESKRAVASLNLGPLIATEMTRCIHCTRCVRFGDEIAGMRELGVTFRGEHSEIGTYIERAVCSEVSGNMIDLCPVGALTAKPSRFTSRPWELSQAASISPHDCLGSHLAIHTLRGQVMRVVAREKEDINETWLSDRDRFSYSGLTHADRLKEPLIKINGEWQVTDWESALNYAADKIKLTLAEFGADQFGALSTPHATVEELYLLQKLTRGLNSPHVDHRLREIDHRDQTERGLFPGFELSLSELETCDAVILIGSNLPKEQPLASLRVRKAVLKGAQVLVINSVDYPLHFPVTEKSIIAPQLWAQELENINNNINNLNILKNKKKICLIIGAQVLHHPEASIIRTLIQQLAERIGARINFMTDGPNTAGGWLAGALPHRGPNGQVSEQVGLSAYEMFKNPRKAYLLLNIEPDFDCANAYLAEKALQAANTVIALSMYRNSVLEKHATVILPMAAFTETAGTYINAEGTWQSFTGVAKAYYAARPAWKILRALANFLDLAGFNYEEAQSITQELRPIHVQNEKVNRGGLRQTASNPPYDSYDPSMISRIGEIPIYAGDSLVRRSAPLQKAQKLMLGECAAVYLHPDTAKKLNVKEDEKVLVQQEKASVVLPVKYDARIAENAAWIPGGIAETAGLGDLFGQVNIQKA